MQPLVVDLMLLRAVQTADLRIVPGRAFMARVVETPPQAASGRGVLSIAGELIEAELPRQLKPGDELRLTVTHVSADKVQLSITNPHPQAAIVQPPPLDVPLPGGGALRVNDDDASGPEAKPTAGGDTHTLALRYETPGLGAVDLRFVLDAGSLKLAVTLPAGAPFALADGAAGELRSALSDQLHRAVEVLIAPRRDPLDVYA